MRNLAELNITEDGLVVDRKPPSAEVIAAFEAEFGVSLPEDYINFLMYSNGGHPELDMIAPMGYRDIASGSIGYFFIWMKTETGCQTCGRRHRHCGISQEICNLI